MTIRENHVNGRNYPFYSISILFLLTVLIMLRQLMSPYYFSCFTSDTYQYSSWAWQFREGLREGVAYPRWTPLNFWGYGSPTFILYPPLAFYLVALFSAFSDSIVVAMNLVKFISLFIAATGIFLLVKEIYSEKIALLTASFYIVFPLSISRLYVGGGHASTISIMWFPLVLFFTYKYFKDRNYLHLLYAGVCYGGLILTHIINAYIFVLVLGAFILYMSIAKKSVADLIGIPIIILTGILISAAYSLPLIYEKQFLNYRAFLLNYADLFILPNHANKLTPYFFWKDYYDECASYVLLFLITTLLFFHRMIKSQRRKDQGNEARTVNIFLVGVSLFSIFSMFGVSTFVWEYVPFFKYIQIPARWLNVTAFAVILLSASFFSMLEDISLSRRRRYLVLAIPFLICLSLDYKYIRSACTFQERQLIPVQAANPLEHLPAGLNIGRISEGGDYNERVNIIEGEGEAEVITWKSAERNIRIKATQPIILRIRTFNFPGWTAYVDGTRAGITTEEGTGAIVISVPSGRHALMLRFVDTPLRYYSKLISLLSILIMSFWCSPLVRSFAARNMKTVDQPNI